MLYLTIFFSGLLTLLNLNTELLPEGQSDTNIIATNTGSVVYTDNTQSDSQLDSTHKSTTTLHQQIDLNIKSMLVRKNGEEVANTKDICNRIDTVINSVDEKYNSNYAIISDDIDKMRREVEFRNKSKRIFPYLSLFSLIALIICNSKNWFIWRFVFGSFLIISLVFTALYLQDIFISYKDIDQSVIFNLLKQ